jgi:hypothetical protein
VLIAAGPVGLCPVLLVATVALVLDLARRHHRLGDVTTASKVIDRSAARIAAGIGGIFGSPFNRA